MKNSKYISVLLLSIFLIPSIAMASWWNPISWFSKEKQETQVTLPIEEPVATKTDTEQRRNEDKKEVIEKVVEKPVVKTITVQDPALQKQINSLIEEISSLKSKINDLSEENENLKDEISSYKENSSSLESDCDKAKNLFEDIKNQIAEIEEKYKKPIEKESANCINNCMYYSPLTKIKAEKTKEMGTLPARYKTAYSNMQLYCN
jgi:predicted RNase H-like nuclease (RuvC/YqgF family)